MEIRTDRGPKCGRTLQEFSTTLYTYVPVPFHPAREGVPPGALDDAGPDGHHGDLPSHAVDHHLPHGLGEHVGVLPPMELRPTSNQPAVRATQINVASLITHVILQTENNGVMARKMCCACVPL